MVPWYRDGPFGMLEEFVTSSNRPMRAALSKALCGVPPVPDVNAATLGASASSVGAKHQRSLPIGPCSLITGSSMQMSRCCARSFASPQAGKSEQSRG